MKTLRFHTGRGGRFNNQGHVTFIEFETIQENQSVFSDLFLNDDETELKDTSGNELNFEINEDGTGYVECDTDYDSDCWVKEDSLNVKQINALVKAHNNGEHWNRDEVFRILNDYYQAYLND